MKTPSRTPLVPLALALTTAALIALSAHAQDASLTIKDVPRATQAGEGPGKYVAPMPAKADLPTLWLIGDSTVRNGSKGDNGPTGQWGWGAPIVAFFDQSKINVVNRAFGGTSSRTFYRDDFWKNVKPLLKKGDYVMMQFGANDNGGAKGKGGLSGIDDKTEMNNTETVHTYGWYLKQLIAETKAAGATPIICSLTPRKVWEADGKFKHGDGHATWAEQVAQETGTAFVPLNEIIAEKYESLGKARVDTLYVPSPKENLHTGWDGAVINAQCVVSGLKSLPSDPLASYFSPRADGVAAWKKP
ncbi:MAG: rhamnogalacturonan acetylesterase [Chthoniobacteraceae bacterium]